MKKKAVKTGILAGLVLSLVASLFLSVSAAEPAVLTGAAGVGPIFKTVERSRLQAPIAYADPVDFTVDTYEQLIRTAAEQFVARDTEFSVRLNDSGDDIAAKLGDDKTFWRDLFSVDLPDTTSDIYYLWGSMKDSMQVEYILGSTYTMCTFTQSFYTSAEEEAYVDSAVQDIIDTLELTSLNAYEKVEAVHDYIVGHVEYDRTLVKYTPYDALYYGQTVCNGYALLTYKILLEAGVPVKVITGTAQSGGARENHAWNVVQLGQWWYNLDVTWDDTARTTAYFLKNNAAFSDHYAASGFPETIYTEDIEISPADFDPSSYVPEPEPPAYDPAQLSDWARDGVAALFERGVVPEALLSDFQNGITRAEFTALMAGIYEYARGPYTLMNAPPFNDISESAFAEEISKGFELGLINGVADDAFDPEGTLTREQCAKITGSAAGLINEDEIASEAALPYDDEAAISDWALLFVRYAYENGLMNGTGDSFEPQGLLTREQAMLIAERMIEKYGW